MIRFEAWQASAWAVVETCERKLWSDLGERARAWLHGREREQRAGELDDDRLGD